MASVLKSKSFTLGTNTAQTEVFNWEDVASRAKQYIDTVREQAQQLLRDSHLEGTRIQAQAKEEGPRQSRTDCLHAANEKNSGPAHSKV